MCDRSAASTNSCSYPASAIRCLTPLPEDRLWKASKDLARLETRLSDELDGARAQMGQHESKRRDIEARIGAVDTEAPVAEELTALRRLVTDEVNEGRAGDLDELRAILRRPFCRRQARVTERNAFRERSAQGRGLVEPKDESALSFDGGCYLLPILRPEAVDLERADAAGFPAVARAALSLGNNLWARFPTHNYADAVRVQLDERSSPVLAAKPTPPLRLGSRRDAPNHVDCRSACSDRGYWGVLVVR